MRPSALCALLFTSVISVVRSTPVPRDNDGSRPITWISADGNQRCWQVDNGNIQANQILVVADCDGSEAQRFIYNTGATAIQVAGSNFCVEFGPGLGVNGRPLRIQTCRRNGAPGQRLYLTDDDHIALQNGPGQCADVTDGGESAQLQSWRCAAENINQIFFGEAPVPPQPSPTEGVTLSPAIDASRCLSIQGGFQDIDNPTGLPPCDSGLPASEKRWFFEIGTLGLRMRSDSGQGFTAIVGPPDRPITVEQDDEYPLDVSFVAEYGSGGYAERLRFSNPLTGLCIQAVLPFEDDYGQYEPLVGFFCNDEEPLQFFTISAFPLIAVG